MCVLVERLTTTYGVNSVVEILLEGEWQMGRVVEHASPAVWVEMPNGRRWFITNTRHIRMLWKCVGAKSGRNLRMNADIQQKLININQQFYEKFASAFSQTRQNNNDGFVAILEMLPQPCHHLLDVGCGNGRFGQFLQQHQAVEAYSGVDFSQGLLDIAATTAPGHYYQRNLLQPNSLDGLPQFDTAVCLAVLHHIPGRLNRIRLLREIGDHLPPGGLLFVSTWQFATNVRQQRKICEWDQIGLTVDDVEPGDYLLSWQRGGTAYRYAAQINEIQMMGLAAAAGLTPLRQFRSDGREGDLSLYAVLQKK